MRVIKNILFILGTFLFIPIVYAENCDINELQKELVESNYTVKLDYNEEQKGLTATIQNLPNGFTVYIHKDENVEQLSSSNPIAVSSGISYLAFFHESCSSPFYGTDIKIPYYDYAKQNVFADGSVVEKQKDSSYIKRILTIIFLSLVIVILGIVAYLMIKRRLKHEKKY